MIRINDYQSYLNQFQRITPANQSQNATNVSNTPSTNVEKPSTTPAYRVAEPLKPLVPKEYSRIYGRSDVAEQGVVKNPARTEALEDFSLTPVQNTANAAKLDASNITDEQMDQFLRKAFKVFDFE